ncbi:MAG: hypothetical protein JRH11_11270 [Deltaproteobacteria bacterium]|nr:hypothetical protein [Deltaproteobacteria bacterium]
MQIRLDKRAVKQIRLSINDAIEEGDTETLREDIINAFSDEQIEEIERRVDAADFYDFISDVLEEWSLEDMDELFEILEGQLVDASIDLKYHLAADADDDDEEDDDDDDDFDDDDN